MNPRKFDGMKNNCCQIFIKRKLLRNVCLILLEIEKEELSSHLRSCSDFNVDYRVNVGGSEYPLIWVSSVPVCLLLSYICLCILLSRVTNLFFEKESRWSPRRGHRGCEAVTVVSESHPRWRPSHWLICVTITKQQSWLPKL